MEKLRRRPKKVMEGVPIGTDIRPKIQELVNQDCDLHYEIEELQFKLRDAKYKRQQIEAEMVQYFVQANMFWMFRINKTALRKFLNQTEDMVL